MGLLTYELHFKHTAINGKLYICIYTYMSLARSNITRFNVTYSSVTQDVSIEHIHYNMKHIHTYIFTSPCSQSCSRIDRSVANCSRRNVNIYISLYI